MKADLTLYDANFYKSQQSRSWRAATTVADIIVDLLAPRSVIDFGCGSGGWLRALKDRGVERILGVEGPHMDPSLLMVSASEFIRHDLSLSTPQCGAFDLALSIEVAEHLPKERADGFVADVAGHADAIVFSGAIPLQGGVNHVNEQWPSYWCMRFEAHGFSAFDAIRPRIWTEDGIMHWYKQGLILYARGEPLKRLCAAGLLPASCRFLDIVHPDRYLEVADTSRMSFLRAASGLKSAVTRHFHKP